MNFFLEKKRKKANLKIQRLYAYENFYSCRCQVSRRNHQGYTPTKISTLVDLEYFSIASAAIRLRKFLLLQIWRWAWHGCQGYTPTKISTLVDIDLSCGRSSGYTPTKISTLVDENINAILEEGYTPTKISTLVDRVILRPTLKGYTPTKISTLVDVNFSCHKQRLYAYENFYSCRCSDCNPCRRRLYAYENFYSCRLKQGPKRRCQAIRLRKFLLLQIPITRTPIFYGYTPTKISTLVDSIYTILFSQGYTPTKISTLVDAFACFEGGYGYTPTKISTLVDSFLKPK